MVNYGYDWENKQTCAYSTRHMPNALLKRLKILATRMDQSQEFVLNQALDLGLGQLERRVG